MCLTRVYVGLKHLVDSSQCADDGLVVGCHALWVQLRALGLGVPVPGALLRRALPRIWNGGCTLRMLGPHES